MMARDEKDVSVCVSSLLIDALFPPPDTRQARVRGRNSGATGFTGAGNPSMFADFFFLYVVDPLF